MNIVTKKRRTRKNTIPCYVTRCEHMQCRIITCTYFMWWKRLIRSTTDSRNGHHHPVPVQMKIIFCLQLKVFVFRTMTKATTIICKLTSITFQKMITRNKQKNEREIKKHHHCTNNGDSQSSRVNYHREKQIQLI